MSTPDSRSTPQAAGQAAQAELLDGWRRTFRELDKKPFPDDRADRRELTTKLTVMRTVISQLEAAIAAAAPAPQAVPDPFGIRPGFHLITDNSGTRHLVDVGGVRYLTEERPGSWELAIRSGNWPALVQLARNILGTDGADL